MDDGESRYSGREASLGATDVPVQWEPVYATACIEKLL